MRDDRDSIPKIAVVAPRFYFSQVVPVSFMMQLPSSHYWASESPSFSHQDANSLGTDPLGPLAGFVPRDDPT